MSRKVASLLTKTQRKRLRDEFEELDEEKTRRDQQRIRNRVQSGIRDFPLLVDLPDRQLHLAFDDVPDEEVQEALVDSYLTIERIREQHRFDREELIHDARERAQSVSEEREDLRTLEGLDLQTASDVRAQTEKAVRDQLKASRWVKRANTVMALGATAFLVSSLLVVSDEVLGTTLWSGANASVQVAIFLLIVIGMGGWTLIMGVAVLKKNVIPSIISFLQDDSDEINGI